MKIANIEQACQLAKDLQEIKKLSELANEEDIHTASLFVLYKNRRFNISSLLTEEQQKDLVKKIFWMIGDRVEKIKQEIEKL